MNNIFADPWTDDPIRRFRGEHAFLSNFHPSPIIINYRNQKYIMATGEHCFQGMKVAATIWEPARAIEWLQAVSESPTPAKSKYLGRSIQLDLPRWNNMAYACMERTQKLKYEQNPELRKQLLATGNRELIEGTDWGDKLWGVDDKGEGQNLLGKVLMNLRFELRTNWLD